MARAAAYDDGIEMKRRSAIAEYLREHGTDIACRQQQVQERLLGVKEALLVKLEAMADWPLEERVVEREDGREVVHTYPARWSFATLIKAIGVLDETPRKTALTDPTGQTEYGQSSDDIERQFMDLLEAHRDPDEEQRGQR